MGCGEGSGQALDSRREMVKEKKYYDALVSIAQVLGTGLCKQNKCEGCQYEMRDAAVTARRAIGWKINGPRKHKK